jgi:oligoendopeptidase F
MKNKLPTQPQEFMEWSWPQIEPFYLELHRGPLTKEDITGWLKNWSHLAGLVHETYQRLFVEITTDTTDAQARQRYDRFLDEIFAPAEAAEQKLKEKLLKSRMHVANFEIPLRNIQAEVETFNKSNLSLLAKELKLKAELESIIGKQTVSWQGKELTLTQLQAVYRQPDRHLRERAWRISADRWLEDRQAINGLWRKLLDLRNRQAANAGLPDYRAYCWKKLLRFDYTPKDCLGFHRAIEQVAVPAARKLYERRRQKLGLDRLRPWDLNVDPAGQQPLKPFERTEELEEGVLRMLERLDPGLGEYFEIMRRGGLLDLENRKNKASGGYCTEFMVSKRPFILMNAIGVQEDVQTLLHEAGHAFHVFEIGSLPYFHQKRIGLEFMEVASTSMELLAAPYLARDRGGFYSQTEAARARIEFLEEAIRFWPYMAVVDAFQHWVYENPRLAAHPDNCDACWGELWERFIIGVDWSELDAERLTGWQRKLHILQDPFYYIEYGLAQLGAFQVWQNACEDQIGAVKAYRHALALGGTVPLPELFKAVGARFSFDADTLQQAVDMGMRTIDELEGSPNDR